MSCRGYLNFETRTGVIYDMSFKNEGIQYGYPKWALFLYFFS